VAADPEAGSGAPSSADVVYRSSATGADTAPAAKGAGDPITLAFGGDVHFEAHVGALLRHPDDALASLRPYLATADVAMVNLETAITGRGTAQPKEFRFRTSPVALRALDAAGVDVVTMANNHAVDFGRVGLTDTLAARRASPIAVVGVGVNAADAYAPAILQVKGRRVAVIGASQLMDWTLQNFAATERSAGIAGAQPAARLLDAVRAARAKADVVVVYLHWGTERMTCPQASQRDLARQLSAAGADVVVGAHPHVTQGAGWLGRTFVDYSLGNFVWYSRNSGPSTSTGVLTLTLEGRRVTASRWTPLRISADGVPRKPAASTSAQMLKAWQQSRSCTGLAARPAA
jgi:poly-gamma-glutamate synthesis protein (capsule biosynthesis protein)